LITGRRYEEGRGVVKDEARAAALYQQACDMGEATACSDLAAMYASGRGVVRDKSSATALKQRACDAGLAEDCGKRKPARK